MAAGRSVEPLTGSQSRRRDPPIQVSCWLRFDTVALTAGKAGGVAEATGLQWKQQPGNVQFAAFGIAFGALFGFVTQNVVGAIGIGLLLGIIIFKWPQIHARFLFGTLMVAGSLAIAFGTANINTVNGYPIGGGGYTDSPYTCGSVLHNPLKNPLSAWEQIEHQQTTDGYDKSGSTFVLDDCGSRLRSFRIDTGVLLGISVIALFGGLANEERWRKREAAEAAANAK